MTVAYHPDLFSRRSALFAAVSLAAVLAASLWIADRLQAAAADVQPVTTGASSLTIDDSRTALTASSDLFEHFLKEKASARQEELPAQF